MRKLKKLKHKKISVSSKPIVDKDGFVVQQKKNILKEERNQQLRELRELKELKEKKELEKKVFKEELIMVL